MVWFSVVLVQCNTYLLTYVLACNILQACWNLPTSGGARSKVGGQKEGILNKNLYFEGILLKFKQKWGGSCPPCPPGSNSPEVLILNH